MQPFLDIGELSGPILVFGGPYSNLQAIRAMHQKAGELGIPAQNTICTGDIIAYCADPVETLGVLRDWGVHSIQGNCEESLSQGLSDCGCGFDEGSQCDLLSKQWFDYSSQKLSKADKQWMGSLPMQIGFEFQGKKFHVIHGGVKNISRFIFASAPASTFLSEMSGTTCDVVIAGHCGLPFTRKLDDKLWHNAGVIGMPANDGTPDVWYSIISAGADGTIEFTHYRLQYDYIQAASRMQDARLAESYALALESGLWPSQDVLPTVEKSQTGHKIDLSSQKF